MSRQKSVNDHGDDDDDYVRLLGTLHIYENTLQTLITSNSMLHDMRKTGIAYETRPKLHGRQRERSHISRPDSILVVCVERVADVSLTCFIFVSMICWSAQILFYLHSLELHAFPFLNHVYHFKASLRPFAFYFFSAMKIMEEKQNVLFALIRKGDLEGFKEALQVHESHGQSTLAAILSSRDRFQHQGMTPFLAACQSGHLDIVEFLLEKGSNVNEKDNDERTPLHLASENGHLSIINRLVELGASVNKKDDFGRKPFHLASRKGHLNIINRLVELGASVDMEECKGWANSLHAASEMGHLDVVERLVELGASVNERGAQGKKALHYASERGHLNVVDRLVELGASVNDKDEYGRTPLYCAYNNGHLNAVSRLVELGASVNEKANNGCTPLHRASLFGHINVIDRLVELGASVREKDKHGETPLHIACRFSNKSVIMFLLRHKALPVNDSSITSLFRSQSSLLAVLSYGFNEHVSDYVLQELFSDVRDLYRSVRDMCPLQVVSFSIIRMQIYLIAFYFLTFLPLPPVRLLCMEG
jgi:ankyrin repeat protein